MIKRGGLPLRTSRSLLLLPLAILTLFNCEYLFDIEPPKIDVVKPKAGISYFNTLPCQLKVTDNYKVERVEVLIDGESVYEFTKEPYTVDLSVSRTGTGTKTLKVVAHDRVGNWSEAQREVKLYPEKPACSVSPTSLNFGYVTVG
ncbi:MAG: hypothetical protein J3T61_12590, partial [Candidatus Brocadiales bacterium]|nr:hypothetical protein [Candidatus Bathyanammoxibius sp.]